MASTHSPTIFQSGSVRATVSNPGKPAVRFTLERLAAGGQSHWFPTASFSPLESAAVMEVLQSALDHVNDPGKTNGRPKPPPVPAPQAEQEPATPSTDSKEPPFTPTSRPTTNAVASEPPGTMGVGVARPGSVPPAAPPRGAPPSRRATPRPKVRAPLKRPAHPTRPARSR